MKIVKISIFLFLADCVHPQIDEPETESRPQTEAEIGDEQLEDHLDDAGGSGAPRPQLRLSRSLSSPDFMKSYKASFDAERDWPHVDDAEDDEEEQQRGTAALEAREQ